jgi:hypothetical protein
VFARFCSEAFLHLIKFTHPSLPGPLYYCDDNQNLTSTVDGTSQVYNWKPMQISIPVEDSTRAPTGNLTIDNTALDMSTLIGLTSGNPPICTIWIVNQAEPNTVIAGPYPMEVRQADLDALQMVVTLEYEEAGDENIPGDLMTVGTTPGIFSASWYNQVT